MNYVSVVYAVVIVIIVIDWYVRGRREFRGQTTRHSEAEIVDARRREGVKQDI